VPQTRPRILLTLLAAAAFLPFLGRRDIVISHEARVVQTARVMAASGWPWNATMVSVSAVHLVNRPDLAGALRLDPDPSVPPLHVNPWLVPILNGEIRLQKPPLPYWCSALAFRLAGIEWSEALARLIPALLGALSTLFVHNLARRTLGRRFALPAALVWVTSYFIPDEFRKVMADPYLAFFSLLAICAWIRSAIRHSPSSILIFYGALALGVLTKGPIIFIHTSIPIILFHILKRRPLPRGLWSHLLGLAIFIALALPWFLYIYNHIPHAIDIWKYESVGEISGNDENTRPFWYYLPQLFLITLPWTPIWMLAIYNLRRTRAKRNLFPFLWFSLIVLCFSAIQQKKNAYLLPAMPAQTLMISQGIVLLIATLRRRRFARQSINEVLIFSSTLVVIALIAFFTFIRTPADNARSPRLACNFIRMALASQPNCTTIPARLPPEAALYLPLGLAFNPQADTLLYLIDDPRQSAETDLQSFARRLPNLHIAAVMPVPIPGAGPRYRYKLFTLTLLSGTPRTLAIR
jgi:4-amino-4-deoxy-L-arabinose transferase-like glycosyltransferase